MQKQVTVRNLTLGRECPAVCVPVMGKTETEILRSAGCAVEAGAQILEWRMDHMALPDAQEICRILEKLRNCAGDQPLLVTFRTKGEGGEQEISRQEYEALYGEILETRLADAIDVELFSGRETMKKLVEKAHRRDVKVIASSHDFRSTPGKEEMKKRLRAMQELGADIAKLAVMPQSAKDVFALLLATAEADEELAIPLITMSMGETGVISRILGEAAGSVLTFGMAKEASAPGQIPAKELKELLQTIHKYQKSYKTY